MPVILPAVPAYELEPRPSKLVAPDVVRSNRPDAYRLPSGLGNDDLCRQHEPPSSLGQFWPKQ